MDIRFNATFDHLCKQYSFPGDFNFTVTFPSDVQQILNEQIVVNEYGIRFARNGIPSPPGRLEDQSYDEDFANHFHVDSFVDYTNDKGAFELGVATLMVLARRFESQGLTNVQLTYSFQSLEMGRSHAAKYHLEVDEVFISDRLSFHMVRPQQIVVSDEQFNSDHYAFLIIDL